MMIDPKVRLSDALVDPDMMGNVFSAESFWPWRTVAKLIDGIPLTEAREVELFRECTGRSTLPTGPIRRLIILAGRRAGKDRFLSAVAVWRAALALDWRKHISAGEGAVCLLLGADRKQGGILRKYCDGLLRAPYFGLGHKPVVLAKQVARNTDDLIDFKSGSSLEIVTNDARLIRGRSAIAVLGSECCYWKTDEFSASSDEEVVGAAEPSMAMCPDTGLLILASSVYRKRGYMYRQFKKLYGNEETEDTLCWFAPSAVMNPSLPDRVVARALKENAPKARAEYLNFWREDVDDFLPLDVIEACTDWGRAESAPVRGLQYEAYGDPASGTGKDSFTIAIGHNEATGNNTRPTIVVDLHRERKPRFVATDVITEYAALLRSYGISSITCDNYAGGFSSDNWAREGITWRKPQHTTSENYLRLPPIMTSPGRVRLHDSATARTQFSGLERHVTSGHEAVRHGSSAHDDVATSIAGLICQLDARGARRGIVAIGVPAFGSRGSGGGLVSGGRYLSYAEQLAERPPPPPDHLDYTWDEIKGCWCRPWIDPNSR